MTVEPLTGNNSVISIEMVPVRVENIDVEDDTRTWTVNLMHDGDEFSLFSGAILIHSDGYEKVVSYEVCHDNPRRAFVHCLNPVDYAMYELDDELWLDM